MSTKVFSARINSELLERVKLLSIQNGESVQKTIEKLFHVIYRKQQLDL